MNCDFCQSFGKGFVPEVEECKLCVRFFPKESKECKKLTDTLLKACGNTDKEITDWLKQNPSIVKRIDRKYQDAEIQEEI